MSAGLRAGEPHRGGLHRLECGGAGVAQPVHPAQGGQRSIDRRGEGAKPGQERPRDGFHVAPGQGEGEDQFKQLVIGDAVRVPPRAAAPATGRDGPPRSAANPAPGR